MFKNLLAFALAYLASSSLAAPDIPSLSRRHQHGMAPRRAFPMLSRSRYMPHQGKRECERRRIGGFYTLRQRAK